jgi:phage protein U
MITMVIGPIAMGLLRFSPHGRKTKAKWRWHEVERIGGYPGLQFLGKGLKTMSLDGMLLPGAMTGHFAGTTMLLEMIGDLGQPVPVALGNGEYWGRYVIESLESNDAYLRIGGVAGKSDISIDLKFFGR